MIHLKLNINGIVQGVGFRPFVHRLAKEHGLQGCAFNNASGIVIHIQGTWENVTVFCEELSTKAPHLARIESISKEEKPLQKWSGFTILDSKNGLHQTLISPDIAPCPECIKELMDPDNRRYHYPFINCTNCGPRYTIIKDIPYDRQNTTMAPFKLCYECAKEYQDIEDRRYHAQPNACEKCGPHLSYIGNQKEKDPLDNAIQDLRSGKIVAIKGIGGFHLACDAKNKDAVQRLRMRKQREAKPLAIMVKDIECALEFVQLSAKEKELLISSIRPIVLCKKKDPASYKELSHTKEIGILLPYSPLHILLMEKCPSLVMTSANLADTPVIIHNDEALHQLKDIADSFLIHDRDIENRLDDSLVRIVLDRPYFIRKSRGYTPYSITKPDNFSAILALGAHQKGSFALGKDNHIFLSPYIGALENMETWDHYLHALKTYRKLFDFNEDLVVCDKHPDYMTTHYAKSLGIETLSVQHHHAHMASCMFENDLDEECFGIIWDGTGYGEDGGLWGGEFLMGDRKDFRRMGSIRPIPLIGNEKAIVEIGRIGLALSLEAGQEILLFEKEKQELLKTIGMPHSLSCTSMGRLFDGFYSLITSKTKRRYEGEPPVSLENMAAQTDKTYPYSFYIQNGIRYFDWKEMIYTALTEAEQPSIQAKKMMNTLIEMAIDQVKTLNPKKKPVVLSGGCFQNMTILHGLIEKLMQLHYPVFWHREVSCNDEGIALGQLAIAHKRRK